LLQDDNLREKMGREARAWVQQNFTWQRVAEKMYRCYSNLAGVKEPAKPVHT
jgi:glycosyltransferase involved in cell wall biosynthesis